MLVLSRKSGEQIIIGDNIRVVVLKVEGNRVTLGTEAPRDVRIVRGELVPHKPKVPIEIERDYGTMEDFVDEDRAHG